MVFGDYYGSAERPGTSIEKFIIRPDASWQIPFLPELKAPDGKFV